MVIQDILAKIDAVQVPHGKKVALAYSGGLDSSLALEFLRRKYKAKEIYPVTVDVGQGKEENEEARWKAEKLGVKQILVDARSEFTDEWLYKAIRANSDYNDYPVSTSMTRQLVARLVALKGRELGCDALMEGSTGKGNDQYRMHNCFKMFASEMQIFAPIRDFDLTRSEEKELCQAWGVPVTEQMVGGDDKTMWCRSIASGAIELNQEISDDIWMWLVPPQKAPDKPTLVELEFHKGVPVKLDGRERTLEEIIMTLNVVGGANGVGKIDMFEDGIMDLKSREIYEAPAAHIILKLHRDLEQSCLTKDEVQFKKMVDGRWAFLVYHGMWYHPLKEALDAFIAATQGVVNGKYRVSLYKGNVEIVHRQSATSLFVPEMRSIVANGFNQKAAKDAALIRGLPFEILARRREKNAGK